MEIRKLEVFCKVVELKSFTKTAEAVLLSQPTVSEHIRSLEEELGQKLIDRLGREVEPTPVGSLLYSYAIKILRLQHETLQAVEQYSGHLSGRITIGSSTIPGTYILPALINTFRKLHPEIKATIRISSSRVIARQVIDGEFDFGVIGAVWNERSLEWSEVFTDALTVAMPPDHPLAKKKSISTKALLNEPFIFREQGSGTRKVISQMLESQGIKENQLQEVAVIGSTAAVKEAVKSGMGLSILSSRSVKEEISFGQLASLPLKGAEMQRPFYLIQRKNRELPPVAAAFTKYLKKEARKEK